MHKFQIMKKTKKKTATWQKPRQ